MCRPDDICLDTLCSEAKFSDTPRPEGRCRGKRRPDDNCLDTLRPEEQDSLGL